jgi:cytochrome oxidase assembly protein ShyY1
MSDLLRVLRRPQWLGMLLALPALIAVCVVAADWQYARHENRAAQEERLSAARQQPPSELGAVLAAGQVPGTDEQFTAVRVSGEYVPESVLVRNRALNEVPGTWVVSPLRISDGTVILVLRGWIESTREGPAAAPAPPQGQVTVTGMLQPSEAKRGAGILSNGEATSLNVPTLCPQPGCYLPYLQATASDPADSLQPVPIDGPGLGPHLGYAGQWLIFALLLPVGFTILLRREVRESRTAVDALPTRG